MTVGSRVLGGRYRLGSVLGQGGMAVVYRAEDLTLGRTVAVKVLRESLGGEAEFLERFRREARAAAGLNHPNIIAVYDVGEDGPSSYMVMEYVEGHDLKELIREHGPLPPEQVIQIGCQIAAALEYAHRAGLVHRDIKSQNVLVTSDGKAKVADFGIAVALGERSITQTGMVIGSVHYMAPEQAEGLSTTPASDVYSLGVVLYEMATGRLPFTAESAIAVARLQLEGRPEPPHNLNPRLPPQIAETIMSCLEKDPATRPATAAVVAAALRGQRAAAAQRTAHVPPIGRGAPPQPGRQPTGSTRQLPADGMAPGGTMPLQGAQQTDVLMPSRQVPRRPQPKRGGIGVMALLLMVLLLAGIAATAGWILGGIWDTPGLTGPRPTSAPVIVNQGAASPTTAPTAAAKPTTPPQPTPSPAAKPTSPPPTVAPTPVPPTPAPTRVPLTPTVPVGLVTVPNAMDKSEAEGTKMMRDVGLTVKIEERRAPGVRDGAVLAQVPPPGQQVLDKSTVTLVIGRPIGPAAKPAPKEGLVLVPNVEGMDERAARRTLEDAGFKVKVETESSRDRKGQVIDQNPGAGDSVRPGVDVRIVIGT